jgi:hypothetical protein
VQTITSFIDTLQALLFCREAFNSLKIRTTPIHHEIMHYSHPVIFYSLSIIFTDMGAVK